MLRISPALGQLISPMIVPAAVAAATGRPYVPPQQAGMSTIAKIGIGAALIGIVAVVAGRAKKSSPRSRSALGSSRSVHDKPAPAQMTAGQINKELDRLDKLSSKLTDEFIAAGRGYERPSETWKLNDPLAERYKQISSAYSDLRSEISRRYGPGAPSRLPRGFRG